MIKVKHSICDSWFIIYNYSITTNYSLYINYSSFYILIILGLWFKIILWLLSITGLTSKLLTMLLECSSKFILILSLIWKVQNTISISSFQSKPKISFFFFFLNKTYCKYKHLQEFITKTHKWIHSSFCFDIDIQVSTQMTISQLKTILKRFSPFF